MASILIMMPCYQFYSLSFYSQSLFTPSIRNCANAVPDGLEQIKNWNNTFIEVRQYTPLIFIIPNYTQKNTRCFIAH